MSSCNLVGTAGSFVRSFVSTQPALTVAKEWDRHILDSSSHHLIKNIIKYCFSLNHESWHVYIHMSTVSLLYNYFKQVDCLSSSHSKELCQKCRKRSANHRYKPSLPTLASSVVQAVTNFHPSHFHTSFYYLKDTFLSMGTINLQVLRRFAMFAFGSAHIPTRETGINKIQEVAPNLTCIPSQICFSMFHWHIK